MINIIGTILVLIQFVIDGVAIANGKQAIQTYQDALIWFLCGLVGIVLLLLGQLTSNAKVQHAKRKADRYEN